MASEISITTRRHLRWHGSLDDCDALLRDVAQAFLQEGPGAGLFRLATGKHADDLPVDLAFWRRLAVLHLTEVCHTPESTAEPEPAPAPDTAELSRLLLAAPPMRGGEYLTLETLGNAWQALDAWTQKAVQDAGGLASFLKSQAPHWHQVGRVCFHLAENKDDPEYPFAFLATYASGLDKAGKPRYLPLAQALNEYAGEQNRNAMIRLLEPVHKAARESDLIAALVESGDIYHPYPLEADEAHAFLTEIPRYETAGVLARVPDWWRRRQRLQAKVTVNTQSSGKLTADALLGFQVQAALGDSELSHQELEALLAAGSGLRFVKGQWVEVNAEKLQQVLKHWESVQAQAGDGISLAEGMRLLAGANADLKAHVDDESVQAWSFLAPGEALRTLLEQLGDPAARKTVRPGKALRATLRPYQQAGLSWLWLLSEMGLGACLADDMGLGKTIQVISLLLLQKRKKRGPSLLVVPASLLGNWKSEIERFAPSLSCVYLHRSLMTREAMDALACHGGDRLTGCDAVLTTYAMLNRQAWLRENEWNLCVLDEAQAIKNPNSRQTRLTKTVQSRVRIAMTGTPVENRLSDLWSLFDFINPGLLGSGGVFKNFVKGLEKRTQDPYLPLRNLVRPYILRRLKTDRSIIKDLPDKSEVKAYCHLTKKQAALYAKQVEDLRVLLETSSGMERRGLVLSFLMRLKQLCNHASQLSGDGLFAENESGKYARLREICEEIASRQEKVLVFTQFREMTEPIASFLGDIFDEEGLVLHGGTPVKQRKGMVDRFQAEEGPPFFVLSLKAGGTGLNLTASNHVIHFDRWWNPAVENQATDRAFRIGQKKNVLVHKFVCRGTLEERIDELIEEKTALAGEVLESGVESKLTEMSNDELLQLVSLNLDQASL